MAWPLIRNLPVRTNLRFVKFATFAAFVSIAGILLSFASMLTGGLRENPIEIYNAAEGPPMHRIGQVLERGFNLGIDFRGGTMLEFEAPSDIDIGAVRAAVENLELGDVQVQAFSDPRRAQIRYESPAQDAAETAQRVENVISENVPGVNFLAREVVGPKVSDELFTGGLIALGLAILLMLIYIWFRFEWQFGVGAILGLFHDVILTLGMFSIFRIEFTLTIIAALLTIIGYGINDTVVVFDRLRENLRKYKKMPLSEVVELSLNETLSRTIITGCTALLALTGLLYFGGAALSGFAIAMIFGIITGTYSSIYVAAPAILLWGVKRGREGEQAGKTKAAEQAG
ncbi:MAG: protein translocase subunit SecF [Hyphomonadaceae bacterium]